MKMSLECTNLSEYSNEEVGENGKILVMNEISGVNKCGSISVSYE